MHDTHSTPMGAMCDQCMVLIYTHGCNVWSMHGTHLHPWEQYVINAWCSSAPMGAMCDQCMTPVLHPWVQCVINAWYSFYSSRRDPWEPSWDPCLQLLESSIYSRFAIEFRVHQKNINWGLMFYPLFTEY